MTSCQNGAVSKPTEDEIQKLIKESKCIKEKAYAPYSQFKVGAALLTECGKIITGCNVENCSYPLCTCAERCVVVKAVSEGYTKFRAIAVSTNSLDKFASPCGNCRQTMSEFTGGEYWVIMTKPDDTYLLKTVNDLLPHSFRSTDLESGQNNLPHV